MQLVVIDLETGEIKQYLTKPLPATPLPLVCYPRWKRPFLWLRRRLAGIG